jgi:hypothetical protein
VTKPGVLGVLTALAMGRAGAAYAQAPPAAQRAQMHSAYEQQTIDEALATLHAKADPSP